MAINFTIQRRNTHLPFFETTYQHEDRPISARERSIKKAFSSFFSSHNYSVDPRVKSCIKFSPIDLSTPQLDIILGAWSKLRKTRDLMIPSPQRFLIEGVADITLFNKKGKTLIIHPLQTEGKKRERRSLDEHHALMLSAKKVHLIKEETTLDSLRKPKIERSKHHAFTYSYHPESSKAGYIKFCQLFTLTYDLKLDELIQWRSKFKLLGYQHEWHLFGKIATLLRHLHRNARPYGGFKPNDIYIKFHQESITEYAERLKESVMDDRFDFPFKEIERLKLKVKPDLNYKTTFECEQAKILDLYSLADLFLTCILKSPQRKHYSRRQLLTLCDFYRHMHKVAKNMQKALREDGDDFTSYSAAIQCHITQTFTLLQHFSLSEGQILFQEIREYLDSIDTPFAVEMESLRVSLEDLKV